MRETNWNIVLYFPRELASITLPSTTAIPLRPVTFRVFEAHDGAVVSYAIFTALQGTARGINPADW